MKQSPEISQNTLSKSEDQKLVQIVSSAESPKLPIDNDHVFLQLRKDEKGQIAPSYQWEVCVKRFIFCIKKEKKRVFFYNLDWFLENKWGLTKRRTPR